MASIWNMLLFERRDKDESTDEKKCLLMFLWHGTHCVYLYSIWPKQIAWSGLLLVGQSGNHIILSFMKIILAFSYNFCSMNELQLTWKWVVVCNHMGGKQITRNQQNQHGNKPSYITLYLWKNVPCILKKSLLDILEHQFFID